MPTDVKKAKKLAPNAVKLLRALSNEKRLIIACALCKGEKSVGALENIVKLSQSALSQHLAKLREDDLVSTRREAQTIYYSLNENKEGMKELIACLCDVFDAEHCPEHCLERHSEYYSPLKQD